MSNEKSCCSINDVNCSDSSCCKNCLVNAITVDSGVGCASAVIMGWLTGSEPSCDSSNGDGCC